MPFVRSETREAILTLSLNRPKANALNLAMLAELHAALDEAERDPTVRAIIISSYVPRFFSGGFDIEEVFAYDRDQMGRFLESYGRLTTRLRQCPKPTVCSIPGHCFAGGTILALACDFRVMAEGEFGIALNEVNVGVVLPAAVFRLAADVVGPGMARRMVLTGAPVPAGRALAAGLVDDIAPPDELYAHAVEIARSLAAKAPATYGAIKGVIREALGNHATDSELLAPDTDAWFTPEAEQRKQQMIAAMRQ
jgi:Delta3-Delta2-enoyl-CoA isomerase